MSRKIDIFRTALGNPLTIHNFLISCPDLATGGSQVEVIVQSTNLPSEQLRDIVLYYLGERIKYPTLPTNSGEWNCSIPENEKGMAFVSIMKAKGIYWKQKSGVLLPGKVSNIDITLRGVNDKKVITVRLHNCYCKGRNDVSLDASDPTSTVKFNATFSFDWIEDIGEADGSANE